MNRAVALVIITQLVLWVLAELARRDLIPEIWLPDPEVRAERERARFRLHLVHSAPRSRTGCTRSSSSTA